MKITNKYVFFWDGVFSNWFPSHFMDNDIPFENAEQYFMFKKACYFGDYNIAELILYTTNPSECKKLGRKVNNFDTDQWLTVCEDIMKEAVTLKFEQNPKLLEELLKYETQTFVEASPYDKIWGIGMAEEHPSINDESKWNGLNLLGKVLTELRNELLCAKN